MSPDPDGQAEPEPDAVDKPLLPQLALAVLTTNGFVAPESNQIELDQADEPDAYAASPGFQTDIRVSVQNVPNATEVRLFVNGQWLEMASAVLPPGKTTATADFTNVRINHGTQRFRVSATNDVGSGMIEADLVLELGTCPVQLAPLNESCLTQDTNENVAGFQGQFVVSTSDVTCTHAALHLGAAGSTRSTNAVAFDADGTATFEVTLVEGEGPFDGTQVQVEATAFDPRAIAREGSTGPISYIVDNTAPGISTISPAGDSVALENDADGNPDNGLQMTIQGQVSGTWLGDVALSVDGEVVTYATADGNGNFAFDDVTFFGDGARNIEVFASDACGQTGSAETVVKAYATKPQILLMSPPLGAVMLAETDKNPSTPTVYELKFKLFFDPTDVPGSVGVRCRPQGGEGPWTTVGTALLGEVEAEGGEISIPSAVDVVEFGTQLLDCQAFYTGPNSVASKPSPLVFALPAPRLEILIPQFGAFLRDPGFGIELAASGLDGQTAHYEVTNELGEPVLGGTTTAAFAGGYLDHSVAWSDATLPLPDGQYVLTVTAADVWGNQAESNPLSVWSVPFLLDRTAPTATLAWPPTELMPLTQAGHADADPVTPGYQAEFRVAVDSSVNDVCVQLGAGFAQCGAGTPSSTEISVGVLTLEPGANEVQVTVTDLAGNESTLLRTVNLYLAPPVVQVSAPVSGSVTLEPSVVVHATVLSSDSSAPVLGATLTLNFNGVTTPTTYTEVATGEFVFEPIPLVDGPNTIVVSAGVLSVVGDSPIITVFRKSTAPSIVFGWPAAGATIGADTPSCAPGQANCTTDIAAVVNEVEEGSTAELTVNCGAADQIIKAKTSGKTVVWPSAVLVDQATCTLSAKVADAAGQTAFAAPIQIQVDRTGPTLTAPALVTTPILYGIHDMDGASPGVQFEVTAAVTGQDAGYPLELVVALAGAEPATYVADAATDTTDGSTELVSFGPITLPEGNVTCTVVAADKGGNIAAPVSASRFVFDGIPTVDFAAGSVPVGGACANSSMCVAGEACFAGSCGFGWGIGASRELLVHVSSLPVVEGAFDVRLCTPTEIPGAATCAGQGGWEAARVTFDGENPVTFDLAGLADGAWSLSAEVQVWPGADLWQSAPGDVPVLVDSVAPSVAGFSSIGNTAPKDGWLNIIEQVDGAHQFTVTTSEPSEVRIELADTPVASFATSGVETFEGTFSLTLSSAKNQWLKVHLTDAVGNASAPPSSSPALLVVSVDIDAPKVASAAPVGTIDPLTVSGKDQDPAVAGYQRNVTAKVTDATSSATACLAVNGADQGCTTPATGGSVTFPKVTLQPGENSLAITATDGASNVSVFEWVVLLDSSAPKVTMLSPVDQSVTSAGAVSVAIQAEDPISGEPVSGAAANLYVNDQWVDVPAIENPIGTYTFVDVALLPGANELFASVLADANEGSTGITTVIRKTDTPAAAFFWPKDGDAILATSERCGAGPGDCVATVEVNTSAVEDGQSGTLTWQCNDGASGQKSALVSDGKLVWAGVTLTDQSTCELSASVQDSAGTVVAIGPISVRVDRVAPVISWDGGAPMAWLWLDDVDEAEGLQVVVETLAQQVDGAVAFMVQWTHEDGEEGVYYTTIADLVSAPGDSVGVSSGPFTVPAGWLQVRVSIADESGNVSNVLDETIYAMPTEPSLALVPVAGSTFDDCVSDSDCENGICDFQCIAAWSASSTRELTLETQDLPLDEFSSQVRVCAWTAEPDDSGEPCDAGGGHVVQVGSLETAISTYDLSGVADGGYGFYFEVEAFPGTDIWVSTFDFEEDVSPTRIAGVWIDTVAPTVTSVAFPDDIEAPIGTLNSNERTDAGRFAIEIELSEEGSATVKAGGLSAVAVAFPMESVYGTYVINEGTNNIEIVPTDRVGNVGGTSNTSIVVDTVAPTITVAVPALTAGENVAYVNPITKTSWVDASVLPGFQIEPQITYSAAAGAVEACLSLQGVLQQCAAVSAGATSTKFAPTSLTHGQDRVLKFELTDAAGNTSTFNRTAHLRWQAPTVAVTSPISGSSVATSTVDLSLLVTDTSTGGAVPSISYEVTRGGVSLAAGNGAALGGAYTIEDVALNAGSNELTLAVSAGGLTTFKAFTIHYKDTLPVVEFTAPLDGAVINASFPGCAGGSANCILDVSVATGDVADGQPVQLGINCGSGSTFFDAEVLGGESTFTTMSLTNNKTCTLTAQVTDESGQVASASVVVKVDRTAPSISGYSQPAIAILQYYDDESPGTPGMQRTVTLTVHGVEAGQDIHLVVTKNDVEQSAWELPAPSTVLDSGSLNVSFGAIDLPQGDIVLTATVTDASGNASTPRSLALFVNSEQPGVGIVLPAAIAHAACATSATCGVGAVCREGTCQIAWSSATARTVNVETLGFPWESKSVDFRVCSNNVALAGNTPCSEAGYFVAATTTLSNVSQTVDLSSLPEGPHTLYAEGELYPDTNEWISSMDNSDASRRQRMVWIDVTAPQVTSLTAVSDTAPPAGVLNLAERNGDGTYTFDVDVTEGGGTAKFYRNGTLQTTVSTAGGSATSSFSLGTDGAKTIRVVVQDEMGNASLPATNPASPNLVVTHKATPPVLAYLAPSSSPLLVGASMDVELTTEANAEVAVTNSGGAFLAGTADGAGSLVFANALSDGTFELVATATDYANNTTVLASSPATIVVDTTPPVVALTAPVAGTYVDGDDSQPAQGGYQLDVEFTNTDAASYQVLLASNCTAAYTGCGAPATVASAAIAPVGSVVASQSITFPVGGTGYYVLTVKVSDSNGNLATDTTNIEIALSDCVVSFTNLPAKFNASDCALPGCNSVTETITAQFVGPCGAVDSVELRKSGGLIDTDVTVDTFEADFSVTFLDGEDTTYEVVAKAAGVTVASSGAVPVLSDFTPPSVNFLASVVDGFPTADTDDSETYGVALDQNGGAAGFQFHVLVLAMDNSSRAGQVTSLRYDAGTPTNFPSVALPGAVAMWPFLSEYKFLTLADQKTYIITAEVTDGAGNVGTASYTATVDMLAPQAVTLAAIDPADVDARRPAVTLHFEPPANNSDGSGGAAAAYAVRYSTSPITNATDWDNACPAENLAGTGEYPAPGEPGSGSQSFTVSGPDGRAPGVAAACRFAIQPEAGTTYYFAARAQDAAGNWSSIAAGNTQSTDDIHLNWSTISTSLGDTGKDRLTQNMFALGDVNSDGFDDVAVGGYDFSGFCILYGHAGTDGDLGDLSIAASSGANYQCITDGAATGLGSRISDLGDVNGDGAADFVVSAGYSTAPYAAEARVYFGTTDGTNVSEVAALTITGISTNFLYGAPVGGGGNFNGDVAAGSGNPLNDVLVGSNSAEKAYLIPGSTSWPRATLDLTNNTDLTDFQVITFQLQGAAGTNFANRLTIVGDVITDVGTAYDEIAFNQTSSNNQVIIVKGRNITGPATIAFTYNTNGAGANDSEVIRLRYDVDAAQTGTFPVTRIRAHDINGDGSKEVIVAHGRDGRVYFFDGANLQTELGQEVRVTNDPGATFGDDGVQGTKGFYLAVPGDYVSFVGNFDGDNLVPGGTEDLVMGRWSFSSWGAVDLRFNVLGDANALYGKYPYTDVAISAPAGAAYVSAKFGYQVNPIGDFNGDGKPDILIGTSGDAGAAYVLY